MLNKTSQCCWIRSVFISFIFLFVSTRLDSTWLELTWLDIRMETAQRKESKWNECKSVRWTDFFSFQIKIKKLQIGDEVFCRNKMCVCSLHFTGRLWFARLSCQETFQTLNGEKKMFIQFPVNVDYAHNVAFFVCLPFFHMCNFSKLRALHISLLNRWVGFFITFFSSIQTQQTVYASSLDLWYCASQVHAPFSLICTKECVLLCTIPIKWQVV